MLEAIREIGEIILGEGDGELIKEMTTEISAPKSKQGKQYVVIVDIDTDTMKADFEIEEMKEDSVKKYLWVGSVSGPSSPQWRATTNSMAYLCSQALPALYDKLQEGSDLKEKIKKIVDDGMIAFSENVARRYRYVWDLKKMEIDDGFDAVRLEMEISQKSTGKNRDKKLVESVADIIEKYIRDKYELGKKDEIVLYTLRIDGALVCQDKEYVELIYDEKINDIFEGVQKGVCSACGRETSVTADPKRFRYKYYNTDKISFSSNISGDFTKNYSLCIDCYKAIMLSEVYINNNLGTAIGSIPLYIIPGFLFGSDIDRQSLNEWSRYIKYTFNTAVTFTGMNEFIKELQDYIEYEGKDNNYILNLLFYRRNQQEFKVLKLIKDVPPSRIKEMIAATNAVGDMGKRLIGDSKLWSIDLTKIFYLIPQRKSGGDLLEVPKLLEIYDCIFSKKPISRRFLIDKFVELAGVYRFEKFNLYNVNVPEIAAGDRNRAIDRALVNSILQCNMLLQYLKILNTLKGGDSMDVSSLNLAENYRNYIAEMGYDEQQTAMFLLGCLISEVANAQYNDGHTSKPVLDKLTYQGINTNKLIRLTTEIFEKLKQYKILQYNEGVFAQMKGLLDKNIGRWKLTDRENVFYILSGYAFNTYRVLTSKTNKKEEDLDEKQ
ncbi:TIGR02556 family CRISPR-associated protein [Caldanaerobius fijiensis]|uniref:TIGR02556 family CRISPR-associated protein n=1 Tax=Caldanaerobius fijiensis TaxID=456330 RepID=UPI00093225CB|nr:TIGR02556 family CRISPR-associated protein [Caldanaerobius fijiensis]